ncbi:MAG: ribulokinase [Candidatus Raymondbacteria bacterium RifOxyA12_full_50_37]|uniref:Ribulokinase n=1 Tax=Candidatus Raymondbacteria bacterium RIFOXYD12_FULL_49_13 TaxID=1817890 RepID=A0A1F7EZF8_UNCRA|nr:MAG: ribulokinase [Candidatus Raymondbacteria bacterium RifOxyA12_full_50_37]OGJ92674.1 MAG: ribulokinase [Candidatus Raymondbacteria bacterium RifOxyB12_full_50_8]OGJ94478.1 MAG: ribulokinase [Candidatus Raymondbacteria bacterium RIFOXYA2_FULL_49_16]OGJ99231.1 MAG: ribulokinase [Candidatus Raymondbacteria bacterium RIFOXYC2_FULL_50_21]OGJ99783.1 MAG: ribulokinase [Candidatus Raymondbacteria bacterium RIFOXYD12_FULL_49_13]OGP45307.1 MAG: ribulokinase [Candidatus Raymondbacteria bacterium RI
MKSFTIGIDYGTNSVRAIVVDCETGNEIASSVFNYPTGRQGIILDPRDHNLARQNPVDYLKGLEKTVTDALEKARSRKGFCPAKVIGLGVDTTGSTPIPVDKNNRPLALDPKFKNNPNAHAWLWKDHTSADEAVEITRIARKVRPKFLAKCGGVYSSEWFWSKVWHCLKIDSAVFNAAYSWVECADFIPAVLAGITKPEEIKRGVCPAGHKAMYCEEWGGLPDKKFLALLDRRLSSLRDRLFHKAHSADTAAGALCTVWANKLGLPTGIPIAIGAFDAHYGAIGAGISTGTLVKIIGTSTCDCIVSPKAKKLKDIPGICGIVDSSILPGYYGLEAGQSAVGDIFKWWVEVICEGDGATHARLMSTAARLKPGQSGLLALDWNNGNRTILVDPKLTGLLVGQTLHTTQAEVYRALIEATAFGARAIIERIKKHGVPITRITNCGGIAEKNPMLMQIYADITGCAMYISGSSQTCALGSAIAAAVAAGAKTGGYNSFEKAQKAMTSVKKTVYRPNPAAKKIYDKLYSLYMRLHDAFGGVKKFAELGPIMKELLDIKTVQNK